ncbi:MAG: hypothetical protein J5526_06785, partial [Bacteroidales bacterium]|nr:hypothetical protein [Bacteroidales bacterium]
MEHTIPPVFTEKRGGNTVGRVKMFVAALLLSLAGIGTAHAQCDDLDPSEFSFNVTMATTLNFEADW